MADATLVNLTVPVFVKAVPPRCKNEHVCMFFPERSVELGVFDEAECPVAYIVKDFRDRKYVGRFIGDWTIEVRSHDGRFFAPVATMEDVHDVLADFMFHHLTNRSGGAIQVAANLFQRFNRAKKSVFNSSSLKIWPPKISDFLSTFKLSKGTAFYQALAPVMQYSTDALPKFERREEIDALIEREASFSDELFATFRQIGGVLYKEVREPHFVVDIQDRSNFTTAIDEIDSKPRYRGHEHFFHPSEMDAAVEMRESYALDSNGYSSMRDELIAIECLSGASDNVDAFVIKGSRLALYEAKRLLNDRDYIPGVRQVLDTLSSFLRDGDPNDIATCEEIIVDVVKCYTDNKSKIDQHLSADFVRSLKLHVKRLETVSMGVDMTHFKKIHI